MDADEDSYCDCHTYSDGYPYSELHTDAHSYANFHAYPYSESHADDHSYLNGNADKYGCRSDRQRSERIVVGVHRRVHHGDRRSDPAGLRHESRGDGCRGIHGVGWRVYVSTAAMACGWSCGRRVDLS